MNKIEIGPKSLLLQALKNDLEHLSDGQKLEDRPTEFAHKNDAGYGITLRRISDQDIKSDTLRVGLVVGNGSVLSSLPRIPADLVILVDRNKFIARWTLETARILSTTPSPDDYRKSVYEGRNSLFYRYFNWWHPIARLRASGDIGMEMGDLGKEHFLSSQEHFDECKDALARKRLLTTALDLTNPFIVARLGRIIRLMSGEITFANLTNVWEHASREGKADALRQTLSLLPFHEAAVILHSSSAYEFGGILPRTMGIQRGLPAYLRSVSQNPRWVKE
ncbi:hypothetical protein HYS94_04835 [Candidatus Daviesbacteria bacterium]|nr:hypothetical protein [Candidatus Daviesbacteria bacterium]